MTATTLLDIQNAIILNDDFPMAVHIMELKGLEWESEDNPDDWSYYTRIHSVFEQGNWPSGGDETIELKWMNWRAVVDKLN